MTMDRLPGEMLAAVLRRLPPRYLAVCRAVCREWRGVIDARGLLLAVAHLLPRPLSGIFINFFGEVGHCFFSRPTQQRSPSPPGIDTTLQFLPNWWNPRGRGGVLDHCNGLLLYESGDSMYVCNPATRRSAPLPLPRIRPFFCTRTYLVFDPTVTLHYNVLFLPDAPMQVFSSTTGQWEEKHFIRVGDPTVTVSDVWLDPSPPTSSITIRRYAVYWQQALYLHCRGGFIVRLSLLEDKYMVIRTPESDTLFIMPPKSHNDECGERHEEHSTPHVYLGKSKLGVYYTILRGCRLSVWTLHQGSELRQTAKWDLNHQADLEPSFLRHYTNHHLVQEINKPWILNPSQKESEDTGAYEWDSSDDSVVDAQGAINNNERCVHRYDGIDLLGYHPCKEIAFLGDRLSAFAYNLDNTKLECLGSLCQTCRRHMPDSPAPTLRSFIYTPCLYDQLPAHNDDE
uniref:Uncharacterized protein n=1 Tax=Avena sativa TaxID=4498 RepID=A0ACD5VUT5_AVESA